MWNNFLTSARNLAATVGRPTVDQLICEIMLDICSTVGRPNGSTNCRPTFLRNTARHLLDRWQPECFEQLNAYCPMQIRTHYPKLTVCRSVDRCRCPLTSERFRPVASGSSFGALASAGALAPACTLAPACSSTSQVADRKMKPWFE